MSVRLDLRLAGAALVLIGLIGLIGLPPSAAGARHARPGHHRHRGPRPVAHHNAPAGGFALAGLGTTIVPLVGVGDIALPSPLSPAQILQRFGRPGPTADRRAGITTMDGAIVTLRYFPYDKPAGISFHFDGPPVNSLDGITITSPAYRTAEGLHVGSAVGDVQRALAQARCDDTTCTVFHVAADGTASVIAFDVFAGAVAQIVITGERAGDPL